MDLKVDKFLGNIEKTKHSRENITTITQEKIIFFIDGETKFNVNDSKFNDKHCRVFSMDKTGVVIIK